MSAKELLNIDIDYTIEKVSEDHLQRFEIGMDTLNFTQCLVKLDESIQNVESELDRSTTTDQVRDFLYDLIEKVQTKNELLDQRFDQSANNDQQLSFNLSFDPRSILSTGRKMPATGRKNVSFFPEQDQQQQQSSMLNRFSSSYFDSPEMKKSRTKSPGCTPHHLKLPLFHRSCSMNTSNLSERSFLSERLNSSKASASSMEDFVDALELTDFANEEEIKNALDRSRLTEVGMSMCTDMNETEAFFQEQREKSYADEQVNKSIALEMSPIKQLVFEPDEQNQLIVSNQFKQKLDELTAENQRLRQQLEIAQSAIQHQNQRFQNEIDERKADLNELTEKHEMLKQQVEQMNLESQKVAEQHLEEIEQKEVLRKQLETEQIELKQKIAEAMNEIEQYKHSIEVNEQLMEKFDAAVLQNQEKDVLIRSIGIENQSLTDKLKQVSSRLAETESESKILVEQLCEQRKSVEDALYAALNDLKRENQEELQRTREEHSCQIAELNQAIHDLEDILNQSTPTKFYNQLKEELELEKEQLANYVNEIRVLKQENASYVQTIDDNLQSVIRDQLNEMVNCVDLQSQVEQIQHECEKQLMELSYKLQLEEKQQEELQAVIKNKTAEIVELQRLNQIAGQEIETMKHLQVSSKEENLELIASLKNEIQILEKIRDDEKKMHIQQRTEIESKFEEHLHTLQNQLDEKTDLNQTLIEANNNLGAENKSLTKELDELKVELTKSNEENVILKNLIKENQLQAAELSDQIKQREEKIEILLKEKLHLESEDQKLQMELNKTRQQMEENKSIYHQDMTTLNNRIGQLDKERSSQNELHESQTKQMQTRISELENIRKEEQQSFEQTLNNLTEVKQTLEDKIVDLQKEINNCVPMQQLDEVQKKLTESEQLFASQSNELKQLSIDYTEKVKNVELEAHQEMQRLESELQRLRVQSSDDQAAFELKRDDLINKYESQLADVTEKHQQLMTKCTEEHVREKNFLQVNILALKEDLATMQQTLETTHSEFESKLRSVEEELEKSRDQEKSMQQAAEKSRRTVTELNVRLNELKAEMDTMFTQDHVNSLKQQLTTAQTVNSDQRNEMDTVLASKKEIELEFATARQHSQLLVQRIEKLNTDNQNLNQQLVGLLEFEQKTASLEQQLMAISAEKEQNRIALDLANQQTNSLNQVNQDLKMANDELVQKLESIRLENQELITKFKKFEDDNEVLEAELKLERNENTHLMQQVKLAKQLKGHSEKEKKLLVSQISNFINLQSNDRQEIFEFLFLLKDKLNKDPNEDAAFKRPSGKAFLQSLAKKPLNTNN